MDDASKQATRNLLIYVAIKAMVMLTINFFARRAAQEAIDEGLRNSEWLSEPQTKAREALSQITFPEVKPFSIPIEKHGSFYRVVENDA